MILWILYIQYSFFWIWAYYTIFLNLRYSWSPHPLLFKAFLKIIMGFEKVKKLLWILLIWIDTLFIIRPISIFSFLVILDFFWQIERTTVIEMCKCVRFPQKNKLANTNFATNRLILSIFGYKKCFKNTLFIRQNTPFFWSKIHIFLSKYFV